MGEEVFTTFEGELAPWLWPLGTVPTYEFVGGGLEARVCPLAEEGWKCRVVTITSFASVVIGHVARHKIDPYLWTDKQLYIGLKESVKLWALIKFLGRGTQIVDARGDKFTTTNIPRFAASVDQTAATDCPPRKVASDVLHGVIDGINDPDTMFLRYAAQVALSERGFFSNEKDVDKGRHLPCVHNRGIMMGEALSGIYLNGLTLTIQEFLEEAVTYFGDIPEGGAMTNAQIDEYIKLHVDHCQRFLDTANPRPRGYHGQSGDDAVHFTSFNSGNHLRLLYRMAEVEPSENTWYNSTRYATFTEECAINVPTDNFGWRYVDSPKPRGFSLAESAPDKCLVIDKIRLIGGYLGYISPKTRVHRISCELVDELIDKTPVIRNRLAETRQERVRPNGHTLIHSRPARLSKYLPGSMGGINHPRGAREDFWTFLSDDEKRVLIGSREFCDPDEQVLHAIDDMNLHGADPDYIKQMCREFIVFVKDDVVKLDTIHQIAGKQWRDVKRYTDQENLISMPQAIKQITAKLQFAALLEGKAPPRQRDTLKQLSSKWKQLVESYQFVPIQEYEPPGSIRKVQQYIRTQNDSRYIKKSQIDDHLRGLDLPSMRVEFNRQ
jgi:hypothetical protein